MKTSTTVAQDLGTWQEEQALDAACCRLLANKIILAHILQGCLPEYSRCSIQELLPCLESNPCSLLRGSGPGCPRPRTYPRGKHGGQNHDRRKCDL